MVSTRAMRQWRADRMCNHPPILPGLPAVRRQDRPL
jgi:hypothetical protein